MWHQKCIAENDIKIKLIIVELIVLQTFIYINN